MTFRAPPLTRKTVSLEHGQHVLFLIRTRDAAQIAVCNNKSRLVFEPPFLQICDQTHSRSSPRVTRASSERTQT